MRFPAKIAANLVAAGNEDVGVAGSPLDDFGSDGMAGDGTRGVNYLFNGKALCIAQIVGATALGQGVER